LDVPGTLAARERAWYLALGALLLLGLALRLRGIHNPLLDHPGWRQGDTAAIARNFATLDFNPFHPQADYDGPPPNYVELELQIVPWLAAVLYRLFGVHEIFGRLLSVAFSLGTIASVGAFARWMFASRGAGIAAALAFAIYPGSVYYGRTFMPDSAMTFFLCAAVFAGARWIVDDDARFGGRFAAAALLSATAILAKPVAAVGLIPVAAALVARRGLRAALRAPQSYAYLALAIAPYAAYDAYLRRIAEWHWASGITRLHVLPALGAAFTSFGAFAAKLGAFEGALGQLEHTMLGPVGCLAFVVAIVVTTVWKTRSQSNALLWAWLAAGLGYAYVVVTVERVDYYLYPLLPLAALWTGGAVEAVRRLVPPEQRRAAVGCGLGLALLALFAGEREIARYYGFNKTAYRQAKALDATLAPGALVVMGHYDPSILYYIDRKGWEEDPYLWTPFDEESAIAKGARYFIAVEPRRLKRNVELSAWLARFPLLRENARWPVYETDPAKILPGAEARWRAFRRAERAHTLPPP
jgi:4-amino-4-deoxy-L-arabinose transferase-like glycosyltransferase